jgi:hypothetical protein
MAGEPKKATITVIKYGGGRKSSGTLFPGDVIHEEPYSTEYFDTQDLTSEVLDLMEKHPEYDEIRIVIERKAEQQ